MLCIEGIVEDILEYVVLQKEGIKDGSVCGEQEMPGDLKAATVNLARIHEATGTTDSQGFNLAFGSELIKGLTSAQLQVPCVDHDAIYRVSSRETDETLPAVTCPIEEEKEKCELSESTGEMAAVVTSGNSNEDSPEKNDLEVKEDYDQNMEDDNEISKRTNVNCFLEKDGGKCELPVPIFEMTPVVMCENDASNEDAPDENDLEEKEGFDLDMRENVEKSQRISNSLQTVSSLQEKDEGKYNVSEPSIKSAVKSEHNVHNEDGPDDIKLSEEEGYDQDMQEDSASDYSPIPALSSPNERDLDFFSRMREEELEFSPAKYSQLEEGKHG